MIQNWALALLKLGIEDTKLDEMLKQAIGLIKLFGKYPEIIKILSTHNLSADEQKLIVDKIFINNLNRNFINFFKLLIDRKKFRQVKLILKTFRDLCNEQAQISYGIIFSTIKLKSEQILKIETIISKKMQQKVELVNKIDLNLIGGIKVKVHDQIFDGSVQGKLLAMKHHIQDK